MDKNASAELLTGLISAGLVGGGSHLLGAPKDVSLGAALLSGGLAGMYTTAQNTNKWITNKENHPKV